MASNELRVDEFNDTDGNLAESTILPKDEQSRDTTFQGLLPTIN